MVDDVTRYHTIYKMAITEALPATVEFATNGMEALEKLADPVPYDLLILDLNMPKLDGEQTLRRIRQDPGFDHMPVIILTGDSDPERQRRLLDFGADDFIEKGSPPEIFVARLKAQIRYKLALDRLARMALDMDIFAAGVLHDIRNLETNILMVTEIARNYLEDDPVGRRDTIIKDLDLLEGKAEHLGRYADEIIRMARESRRSVATTTVAIEPIINWITSVANGRDKTGTDIRVSTRIEGSIVPVLADPHFLKLALLNIIQNSVKYRRPDTQPEIIVYQRSEPDQAHAADGKKYITTCIRDHGSGIKAGELRKVFEPFARGSDRTKKDGGFGLGLSLVAKVVNAMGGRVWAELPGEGYGTVMCISLPAAQDR